MRGERGKLSCHAEVARAIDYLLKRWPAFTRFLDDGRFASPTTPPSERCAGSRSAASRGCSAAPIARANARR